LHRVSDVDRDITTPKTWDAGKKFPLVVRKRGLLVRSFIDKVRRFKCLAHFLDKRGDLWMTVASMLPPFKSKDDLTTFWGRDGEKGLNRWRFGFCD
jgi:hypothetical protein